MGKIDDVDSPTSNTSSNIPPYVRPGGRYQREPDDFYRDVSPGRYGGYGYGDRYSSRYGSVLSEVETETNPDVKPVQLEHWFSSHWRPAMAWLYFAICAFDFIAAPMFTFWFSYFSKIPYVPWEPLTLHGGGLIHVSLGAIIGVYTWSRTREKLAEYGDYSMRRDYR